jgi:hypothetical protein
MAKATARPRATGRATGGLNGKQLLRRAPFPGTRKSEIVPSTSAWSTRNTRYTSAATAGEGERVVLEDVEGVSVSDSRPQRGAPRAVSPAIGDRSRLATLIAQVPVASGHRESGRGVSPGAGMWGGGWQLVPLEGSRTRWAAGPPMRW